MVGVTNTAISNYKKDISFPNTNILYKLFDALDCDANFLFQDEVKKCKTDISLLADIVPALENGEIIEEYPDDYPYKSFLVLDLTLQRKPIIYSAR